MWTRSSCMAFTQQSDSFSNEWLCLNQISGRCGNSTVWFQVQLPVPCHPIAAPRSALLRTVRSSCDESVVCTWGLAVRRGPLVAPARVRNG
eukprot:5704947-Prymnesium_polylepis.1